VVGRRQTGVVVSGAPAHAVARGDHPSSRQERRTFQNSYLLGGTVALPSVRPSGACVDATFTLQPAHARRRGPGPLRFSSSLAGFRKERQAPPAIGLSRDGRCRACAALSHSAVFKAPRFLAAGRRTLRSAPVGKEPPWRGGEGKRPRSFDRGRPSLKTEQRSLRLRLKALRPLRLRL